MNRREHLFFRIAKPIIGFGIVFAVLVLLVQGAQQEKNLTRELQSHAGILATTFELLLVAASPQEVLVNLASQAEEKGVGIVRLALLDSHRSRVIAAVPADWSGALWADVADLNPLIEGRHTWWLDGPSLQVVVLPVSGPGLNPGSQLLLTLDGSLAVNNLSQILQVSLLSSLIGVLLFALGASLIVRTQVLRPIDAIKDAVERRRLGAVVPIPKLRNDEIGALAELLESSLAEGERLDDQLKLMSRAIQGSSNEVYIIEAGDLRLHLANRSARKNLGYTKEELAGMHVPEIARELQDEAYLSELAGYLKTGGELTHRYTHTRKDGTQYPFEFTAIPVIQNERAWLIVLGNDVTEKHSQEEALRISEERLKLAVQGSNDGVFDYDLEKEELYLSERLRGWLELVDKASEDQLPPIEWAISRVHAEDLSTVRMAAQRCLSEGQEFDMEFRFRNNSGVYRWLQVRGHAARGEAQETRRITGFVSDITRRKVAEILLKDTVARLGAVLDNITDGIVTLNGAGEVCAINPACEVMLRVSRDVLISRPFEERLTIGESGWDTLADRQLRECVAARGEGDLFPVEYSVTRLDTGSDERFIVVFRDISQRKRAEDELHQAVARAQAATLAKGEFLATMSHEIRTPMNGVLGMTQLLMDMQLNDEQRETAEVIHASGEALLTIINDILDFSKVESGKLLFEIMPFDLRVTIREVMDLLSANKRQIELYIDFPADVPGNLLGDLGRVRQVLMNLIGNAVKFTEAGSVVVRVSDEQAQVRHSGLQQRTFARLKVSVQDTGCGIAERAQSRLFDSFTQADASTTRKHGGTGLGLAISRRLVELMGGEIGLRSVEGEGSEFWFTLNLPTYSEDVIAVPAGLDGQRLLLVVESEVGRRIYQAALREAGLAVEAVRELAQADRLLSYGEYRFVLLDQKFIIDEHLANIAGWKQHNHDLKVVACVSADARGGEIGAGLIDARIIKPVLAGALVTLFDDLVSRPDGARKPAAVGRHIEPASQGRRRRVLLAEDNVINQKVAVRMLEKLGCRVDVAANGEEAVNMWEQFPYEIIFMDCQMPEVDGLEATRQIRQLEILDGAHTPIIAMTANAMDRDEQNCRAAGMDDYLSKPVKTDQLRTILELWGGEAGARSA